MVANELSCPVQPRFNRFRFDAEEVRGFLDTHSLNDPRDEYQSIDVWQIVSCLFDKLEDLPLAVNRGSTYFGHRLSNMFGH